MKLLKDVLSHDFEPVALMNVNQGAIALVKNPTGHMRSTHIGIRYHYVCECFQLNCVTGKYVPSSEMRTFQISLQNSKKEIRLTEV